MRWTLPLIGLLLLCLAAPAGAQGSDVDDIDLDEDDRDEGDRDEGDSGEGDSGEDDRDEADIDLDEDDRDEADIDPDEDDRDEGDIDLDEVDNGEVDSDEDDRDEGDIDLDEIDSDLGRERPPLYPEEITEDDLTQRVLVVPFRGSTRGSEGIGELLGGYLYDELSTVDHLSVVDLADCTAIEGVEAELYYAGCPAGSESGCQFVIGEVNGLDRVVGGRVTARDDEDRYRVVVTILNVVTAQEEYSYALDLGAGEDNLLPRTAVLALNRLRREELLAPYREAEEDYEGRVRAMQEAATDEEERLVARMEPEIDDEELAELARDLRKQPRDRITQRDIDDVKEGEGVEREWETMGLTERQYLSYKNSDQDFDDWRARWAGHRLQILLSGWGGFVGGATGLRYYGHFLYDAGNLQGEKADFYALQQVEAGTGFVLGFSAGFGILRNLDVEFSGWWSRNTTNLKLYSDTAVRNPDYPNPLNQDDDPSNDVPDRPLIPDPTGDAPPATYSPRDTNLFGGDVMFRFYPLQVPMVRPSIGAGIAWITYPNLENSSGAEGGIPNEFQTFKQLTDFGIQVEGGVNFDFHPNVGLFLRTPVMIALNPSRRQEIEGQAQVIELRDGLIPAPFGTVKVVIGVQGRLFGKPLQPKFNTDDDILDEDKD